MSKPAISMIGTTWKRFYNDPVAWPEGTYHDDYRVLINGVWDQEADLIGVANDAKIQIECGVVLFYDGKVVDLLEHYQAWEKRQTLGTGAFEAPLSKMDAVKAAIVAAGGTLI